MLNKLTFSVSGIKFHSQNLVISSAGEFSIQHPLSEMSDDFSDNVHDKILLIIITEREWRERKKKLRDGGMQIVSI